MRQVRNNVFETNSSSQHTLSLHYGHVSHRDDIPQNEFIEIDTNDYADWNSNVHELVFRTEMAKLAFMLIICYVKMGEYNYNFRFTKNTIDSEPMSWLADVIEKERGSYLVPKHVEELGSLNDESDLREFISDVSHLYGNHPFDNEEDFKKMAKEIIFDDRVVIKDEIMRM